MSEQLDLFPPPAPTETDLLACHVAALYEENRVLRLQLATALSGIVRPDEIREMIEAKVEAEFEARRPRRVVESDGNVRVLRVAS